MKKKTAIASIVGVCAGLTVLALPVSAYGAEHHSNTSRTSLAVAPKQATLTFTGGTLADFEIAAVAEKDSWVRGTTTNGKDFIQDPAWDQEAQTYDPGMDLQLHVGDVDIVLSDLTFNKSGKVSGFILGNDCWIPNASIDLSRPGGDREGEAATATVDGEAVTITFTDGFGTPWILNFTLAA